MYTKEVIFYKIKTAGLPSLYKWGDRLMHDLHKEALDTLREESCIMETLYLVESENEQFGLFVAVFENQKKSPNMKREINKEHFRYMDAALTYTTEPLPCFRHIDCIFHLDSRV